MSEEPAFTTNDLPTLRRLKRLHLEWLKEPDIEPERRMMLDYVYRFCGRVVDELER